MERAILAAYNGLTIAALMVALLSLAVLLKCFRDKNFGSTASMAVALFMLWTSEFVMRAWWAVWKAGYISREPVAWMMDHPVILMCCATMIGSAILFIRTLADDSPSGRLWKIALIVVSVVVAMVYMIK